VALGGFEMNSPQHPKWNQPRKGARNAARQSRNRTGQADRKMGDRKMKRSPIFMSSIFLSVCLPVRPPSSSRFSRRLPTTSTIAVQRDAEKEERKGSSPLRSSARPP
jgi:hypothetical protein